MRIGIFGNTNNYPLLLAMGLRQLGHDAVLVVNRTEPLHRPESKYPQLRGAYPYWMFDCSDIPEEEFIAATPRIGAVLDFLSAGSDALVLNDLGPSLLEFCPLPAVALMTGSDLTYYADPRMSVIRRHGWSPAYAGSPSGRLWLRRFEEFVARQQGGLRQARAVSAPLPGLVPEMDALLAEIGVADERRDFFYLADTKNPPVPPQQEGPLRIVNGARLNWRRPLPDGFGSQDHKGTDVLLAGFAEFVAGGGDAELVLYRKGLHVADTERLAETLGVSQRVVWRDEATLGQFHQDVASASIVSDQLGSSFPGMVAVDAMAMGIPVIANFRTEILGRLFPEPIAACHAVAAADVAGHLRALARSARVRTEAGRAARRFARRHLSPTANAQRCLRHLGVDAARDHRAEAAGA